MAKLSPHQTTALVVLYMRAKESKKPDGMIKDYFAEELVGRIDYDFAGLDEALMRQKGIAARTMIFDRETAEFVNRHPDGTIINLGAGLDTRFFRIDNGKIRWFDIDLPEMIDLRRQLMTESERLSFIAASVLEFQWMDRLPKDSAFLFVAEGLFIYFDECEVRSVILHLCSNFPGAKILLDATSSMLLKDEWPGIDQKATPFKWGVSSLKELETWDPRIRLEQEWYFRDLLGTDFSLLANLLGQMVRPDSKIGRLTI